jgi:GT2 family glycosyltransferase
VTADRAYRPEISVLIPTRNRAHYLPDCLRSLSEQTDDPDLEVVVVDNGSSDGTAGVLAQWSSFDSRIRSIYEPRPGRSVALNTGIRVASGRMLLFTDDDVIVQPGWIGIYREFFGSHGDARILVGGPILNVPLDLQPWPSWLGVVPPSAVGSLHHGHDVRPLEPNESLWGANMAARRELFRHVGGWEESLGVKAEERGTFEDLEIQNRVRAAGGTIWYLPGAEIHHRLDRAKVTPRSVLFRAFHGGLSASVGADDGERARRPRDLSRATLRLIWEMATWSAVAAFLHLLLRPETIQRGRQAAWRTGWYLGLMGGFIGSDAKQPFLARTLHNSARWLAFGVVARLAPAH